MSNGPAIDWPGASGKRYRYYIHPLGASFPARPGNYIFAKEVRPGYWAPCYIGQTENLAERLGDHEKEACAKRHGATHVHVHENSVSATRRAEETDLIRKWQPPCNERDG